MSPPLRVSAYKSVGAGTFEFIMGARTGEYFILDGNVSGQQLSKLIWRNTRLQVE